MSVSLPLGQIEATTDPFSPLHSNPLLGETYECIRPDKGERSLVAVEVDVAAHAPPHAGFKFVAEKVSHTPVIMAFHSEGKQGWEMNGYVAPMQKFWGRSMEVSRPRLELRHSI